MFDPLVAMLVSLLYAGALFMVALWAERLARAGRSPANNPWVYALSLAVYCTAWTYYGSVGIAASSGLLFLTVYLGPTLGIILWWKVLRRMTLIKSHHHITSIADFISARYDKSETLAALATVLALFAVIPYISLQLKAIISTFALITAPGHGFSAWIAGHVGPILWRCNSLRPAFALLASRGKWLTLLHGALRCSVCEKYQTSFLWLIPERDCDCGSIWPKNGTSLFSS